MVTIAEIIILLRGRRRLQSVKSQKKKEKRKKKVLAYNFFLRVLRPVFPKQQQASNDAPERCENGEVTDKLDRGASTVSGIDTWYG